MKIYQVRWSWGSVKEPYEKFRMHYQLFLDRVNAEAFHQQICNAITLLQHDEIHTELRELETQDP